ncbi:hypothetical protein BCR33DRAFT_716769 [Rhizoclosmatium globosum]|uniref:Uncharacterized protein n=1 Tax=Rhizoclosmatium globosum TaxID=329046 RepID=A0A1Y2CCQ4_9FUNG|nr:hypothetical protein BCR33DRAFT_716769 [Rhizoclosmatium globosum]|eukprot:ORY44820.1 hypothetical protein BCR33DRAFT_716769 [Rhizoclosmatium globosum]
MAAFIGTVVFLEGIAASTTSNSKGSIHRRAAVDAQLAFSTIFVILVCCGLIWAALAFLCQPKEEERPVFPEMASLASPPRNTQQYIVVVG